ncbi:MAG: hypothetical protein ACK5JT_12895 [Hyphomicrobiaceae bacterium]
MRDRFEGSRVRIFAQRAVVGLAIGSFALAAGAATALAEGRLEAADGRLGQGAMGRNPAHSRNFFRFAPTTVIRPYFDYNDEAAALEAVQVALTQVGDGSSYVWYRSSGRVSGVVQPTRSFKDRGGRVCRALKVTLSAGSYSRRTSTVACRLMDGSWEING